MTPDERGFLQDVGVVLLPCIIDVAIFPFFFGIVIGVWLLLVLDLYDRGMAGWPRKMGLVVLIMTFSTGLVNIMQPLSSVIAIIRGAIIDLDPDTFSRTAGSPYVILRYWTELIDLLLNDAVVVWRACILCSDIKWMFYLLCFMLFGAAATVLGELILSSNVSILAEGFSLVSPSQVTVSNQTWIVNRFNTATNGLSLAINLFSTILIFYELWRHRKFIAHIGFQLKRLTSSQRILLLLVESGFIICIGNIVELIVYNYTPASMTFTVYLVTWAVGQFFQGLLPLYPLLVLLIVQTQHTVTECFGFSSNLAGSVIDEEAAVEEIHPDILAADNPSAAAAQAEGAMQLGSENSD